MPAPSPDAMKIALVALLLIGSAVSNSASAAGCEGLRSFSLPNTEATSAAVVTALRVDGASVPLRSPACKVELTARPTSDSDIRIGVLIPEGDAWNGKFFQIGNGGFAGRIPWGVMALALARGYAVAGTDNGHQDNDGASAKWGLGHPEKVVDFGWRAVKTTTDVAKAVIFAHGAAAKRNYFFGCSDGGREALMTAQRFPQDFEGIVAGAPAWPWTRMMGAAGSIVKESLLPGRTIAPAKLPALQAAALAACGEGKSYIADPRQCLFDPAIIACTGADSNACLMPGEVETARLIYQGRSDPVSGRDFPGLAPGAEALPNSWAWWGRASTPGDAAEATSKGFGWNYFAYLVKQDPKFDLRNLTDADIIAGDKLWAKTLNADNADLRAFKDRGGKLLGYHGWNDPAIPPGLSLEYLAAVKAKTPGTKDFYRMFLVPGMLHCRGGAAPVDVDWFKTLDQWVESGEAPATLEARGDSGRTQILTASE